MKNFSNQGFIQGGKTYFFSAQIHDSITSTTLQLDPNYVEIFEYVNQINNYCLTGKLIYIDNFGRLDNFLFSKQSTCQVSFTEVKQKHEGFIKCESISSTENTFSHQFIVDGIEILTREGQTIKYCIYLMDINWFKCQNNLTYSNYNYEPESIFDILKSCIIQSGLIPSKSFENIITNTNIYYTTNGNDNLFSITSYLLNKSYYYIEHDNTAKTIIYNERSDEIELFDIDESNTAKSVTSIILSFFKSSNIESFQSQVKQNLGTVVNIPRTYTYSNIFFNRNITDYNYNENKFINLSSLMTTNEILEFTNNKLTDVNTDNKNYQQFYNRYGNNLQLYKTATYWNESNLNIYHAFINSLLNDNSFIVNTSGLINRIPGDFVTVSIDKSISFIDNDNLELVNQIIKAHQGFEGIWNIGKVRHMISPMNKYYMQDLILLRNFKMS